MLPSQHSKMFIFILSFTALNLRSTTFVQSSPIENNLRIVGGSSVTSTSEFPFVVNVRYNKSSYCTGVLVSHQWVLTAGHCADKYLSVHYGSVRLDEGVFTNTVDVIANYTHPDYIEILNNSQGIYVTKNDLALLKLKHPLNYSKSVQPAPFPKAESTLTQDNSTIGVNVGFGYIDDKETNPVYLQKVNLKIYSVAYCKAREIEAAAYFDPKTMFCAGDDADTKGQCSGDSGGPILVNGLVWGIVSHTDYPCISAPGVYMNVVPYLSWIQKVTGLNEL